MKNKILAVLREGENDYISGALLSEKFGVSRTAVWKHISQLKKEGYHIESVTNRGYRLCSSPTELDSETLKTTVKSSKLIQASYVYSELDSTNAEAKRFAADGDFQNTLIVSREQKKGRGRLGRQWDSPKDAGLWMSLLIKPPISPERASVFTLMAAAAMAQAIEVLTKVNVGIKWPNDLVINDKKVCGILTEISAEMNQIHYLVIGVGVNLYQETFPDDLEHKATSILRETHEHISKLNLIKEFVSLFEMYYNLFVNESSLELMIQTNREKSVTLHKDVCIVREDNLRHVYAKDIDATGNLIIVNEHGDKEAIYFGEVSVRGINGYV